MSEVAEEEVLYPSRTVQHSKMLKILVNNEVGSVKPHSHIHTHLSSRWGVGGEEGAPQLSSEPFSSLGGWHEPSDIASAAKYTETPANVQQCSSTLQYRATTAPHTPYIHSAFHKITKRSNH